jgi:methylmalonyl-CoA/ethylmalonyl-CoA epimerase
MTFHHIGFVVNSIERYERNLFFEEKMREEIDPIQKAKLSLYRNFGSSCIELIEPLEESSFTWRALKHNGNTFHHLCYEIDNMDKLSFLQEKQRWIEILEPVPALLFDNKLVTFYMDRNKQIIEILISRL